MRNTCIINIVIHEAKSVRLKRLALVVCIMKWRWDVARIFIHYTKIPQKHLNPFTEL